MGILDEDEEPSLPEKYPEHAKLRAKRHITQGIKDFLDFCAEEVDDKRFSLCIWLKQREEWRDIGENELQDLMFKFIEVDRQEFYREKDRMLEELRKANGDRG